MGPIFVVSQGKLVHSKHNLTPLLCAQLQIWQNLFSRAKQPAFPFGHVPLIILGHFSHAIPQTPTFIFSISKPFYGVVFLIELGGFH